jgi:hypothetical protein
MYIENDKHKCWFFMIYSSFNGRREHKYCPWWIKNTPNVGISKMCARTQLKRHDVYLCWTPDTTLNVKVSLLKHKQNEYLFSVDISWQIYWLYLWNILIKKYLVKRIIKEKLLSNFGKKWLWINVVFDIGCDLCSGYHPTLFVHRIIVLCLCFCLFVFLCVQNNPICKVMQRF